MIKPHKNKRRRPDRRMGPRRKTVLVEDWRNAWKWLSVQIALLIAGAQSLMVFVPTLHEVLPASWLHGIMAVLAVCVILARVKNQAPK